MEEKSLKDVSKRCKDLFQRGEKAFVQKNYQFAVDMFREAVLAEPAFIEGREKLRKAQLFLTNGGKLGGFAKFIAGITSGSKLSKGAKFLKEKKFAEACNAAEEVLSKNPIDQKALLFLVKCGDAMKLPSMQTDSYKVLRKFYPKNIPLLRQMADFYKNQTLIDEMLDAYQAICNLKPSDGEAASEMKAATAFAAMNQGKWEQANSYRDIIKDKDKSAELEQMELKQIRDVNQLNILVKAINEKIAKNGETIADRKRLAELYSQGEMWTESLENYVKVTELSGTVEPAIANIMSEIHASVFDKKIGETTSDEEKESLLEGKKKMLYEHWQGMVKRYPNDPSYRFEYGMALFSRGEFTESLVELQQSQRNPRFKSQAGRIMGQCFLKREQLDMAVDQFNNVLKDLPVMNEDKKETLYYLGITLEAQEKGDEAVKIFKEILQSDVSYRDVDKRINVFYEKNKD